MTGGRASPEQIARLVEYTGAGLYRTLIDWRSVEPERNRYDWSLPDSIYSAMVKRGIRPVFIIAWAPPWAWDPAVRCLHPHCHFPPGAAFDPEWREFAALLAARYRKLAAIEIWNEANESTAWNPQPDPERFADLVREAGRAVKGVNPSIAVVSGGLSNREVSDAGGLSLADFAGRMFRRGTADNIDGIGIHPYVPLDGLDRLHRPLEVLRSLTPERKPIWVTEVGTSTSGGQLGVSEEDQARAAVETYKRFDGDPQVRAILMHTLIDPQPGHVPPEDVGYGVLRGDLSEKPAYCALARATGARSRCP